MLTRRVSAGKGAPAVSQSVKDFKFFAGYRVRPGEIESTQDLSGVLFHKVINEQIKLSAHLYSRIAVAQISATDSKKCILFVDRHKVSAEDVDSVVELLKNKGFSLQTSSAAIYYATSSLVIALSQGHMDASRLSVERDIAKDSGKNSLMSSFTDIVNWAYVNKADDIDFALNLTSTKSQICFKIIGKYVFPNRFLLPTETVSQMLGIAWQKSTGGASAQFETKVEQQAQVQIDLPKTPANPAGGRVRLRWSGMAIDKGTTVTMRLQRLGESASIQSLEEAGYPAGQVKLLKRVTRSEGGMGLFSGVVGSGKSTSIVQLIHLLPDDLKIVSIEDPVELEIQKPGAYQKTITRDLSSVGGDAAFASATRALYRSAMDVLYLGEIRDPETGLVARQVAESGHSVYSTIHAKSGMGIIDRLASPAVGIPRSVLATPGILKLLCFQALLPVTCPHCGKSPDDHAYANKLTEHALDEHQRYFERIHRLYGIEPDRFRLRDALGCEHCAKPELHELNGFNGRTVAAEMIELDDRMLELVLKEDNVGLQNYWRSMASSNYMDSNLTGKTAMEAAIYKAAQGIIDPREIEPRFEDFETVEIKQKFKARSDSAKHSKV